MKDCKVPVLFPCFSLNRTHYVVTKPQSKSDLMLSALKCVLVCFAVAFLILSGNAHAQGPPCPDPLPAPTTDKNVLILLYCATDGPNWTTPWQIDQSLGINLQVSNSNWRNVATDANGRVTLLYLENNNLTGEIPRELGNLINLTHLSFFHNKLTGEIPRELGNLTNLTELNLKDNKLTGEIPRELGNLTNLTVLDLENNKSAGEIPRELGNLTKLTRLDLERNELTGEIPRELGNLTKLTSLYVNSNNLSGTIPTELGTLPSLSRLSLQENSLSGTIPTELGTLPSLSRLSLQENSLSGTIPTELGNLTKLTNLHVNSNNLSGTIPTELGNLPRLTRLFLQENSLSGTIPVELFIDDTQMLRNKFIQLDLSDNQLSGTIPTELVETRPLKELALSRNQLTGDIPAAFWDKTGLSRLYLNGNKLTWAVIPTQAQLEALGSLQELYLNNNLLEGEIPVAGLEALTVNDSDPPEPTDTFKELALWGNEGLELSTTMSNGLLKRVDRAVLRTLFNDTNGKNWKRIGQFSGSTYYSWLFRVDLFGNERDPALDFSKLPGVTVNGDGRVAGLQLINNNLEGEITDALQELGGLQVLDLSGNKLLGGTLPEGLMDLSELGTVNIQCTDISTPVNEGFQTWLLEGTHFIGGRCPSFSRPRPPPPPPAPEPIDPSQDDMEELRVFYLETGGENWTDNTNWLSEDEPLSQWSGVRVNSQDRVTEINLPGNGLSGSVPPSLGHSVSELETLDLADNPMLSGMLPLSLMNLSGLQTLNVEGTDACAPDDAEFQRWLGTIGFRGDNCVVVPPDPPEEPETEEPETEEPETEEPETEEPETEEPETEEPETEEPETEESGGGACAIAGSGNTAENTVFNLFLIMSVLIVISWKRAQW